MWLEIKDVNKCRNGAYGNFVIRGNGKSLITVSQKRNPTMAEYAATLVHELFHAYFTCLRLKGLKITNELEHKVIYDFEALFIKAFRKHFRHGKPVKKGK
jgi:hypothetical protein